MAKLDLPDLKQLEQNAKAAKKMASDLDKEQKELAAERKQMAQLLKVIDGIEEAE